MSAETGPALTPEEAAATARVAGYPFPLETATRVAAGISPALQAFSAIAGTVPFDCEPATFTRVQRQGAAALAPEAGE